ncbi:MAG: NAD-dependent epimerase/dehydratase family protein, partial [Candidatus Omnitrophica bacterium]|nr:NAD-dependent epimerase/dehydratase family protein [Candidatus Omnitrophota bacterium]
MGRRYFKNDQLSNAGRSGKEKDGPSFTKGESMRAIVTGGAGFIGSNLADALEERGAKVLIIDDFSSSDFENLKNFKGELIAQDVNEVLWDKLGDVDVIFHEAALTDTTVVDQKKMMFNNV